MGTIFWVLSAIDAHGRSRLGDPVGDIGAHARLLIALPLLIVAEPIVHERVTGTVRQFVDAGSWCQQTCSASFAAVVPA